MTIILASEMLFFDRFLEKWKSVSGQGKARYSYHIMVLQVLSQKGVDKLTK